MTTYSDATADALTSDCRFLRARACETGAMEQAIFENDECRVRITAFPNGQISLHFNPGTLMNAFARIMTEDEAVS